MIGFDIRRFEEKDYNNIINLNNNLDYFKIKSFVNDLNSYIIVAQLNDDIVGYASFTILSNTPYKKDLIINEILVDEGFRGLGIGHQLMLDIEKVCREYNVELISTLCNEFSDEELVFFSRHGFKFTDEMKFQKQYYTIWNSMIDKFISSFS